jgi:hypothetical protein
MGLWFERGGNPQGLLRDDVANPQQTRDPGGLLRRQQHHIRVQEAVREGTRRSTATCTSTSSACAMQLGHRAHHHLRLPGEGQDRTALGDASVEADIRAEAEGDNDDRRGEFVPPGVHEGLQQAIRRQARHGIVACSPRPRRPRRSTSTYPSNSKGPRTTDRHSASGAKGTNSSTTKAFNGQDSAEDRHRHLRHQVGEARRRVRRQAMGPGRSREKASVSRSQRPRAGRQFVPGPNHPWRRYVIKTKKGVETNNPIMTLRKKWVSLFLC